MALAKVNSDNARIFGSDDDYVAVKDWVADLDGTELDDLDELKATAPTGFTEVGWLHPDGISLEPTDELQKLKGYQGGRTIRTKITSSETSFKFQCLESTALTLGLALDMDEGTTTTGGITKHTIKGAREVIKKTFAIGLFDGDVKWLLYVPHGEIGERTEINLGGEEIVAIEFTVEVIGDAYLLSADPALA